MGIHRNQVQLGRDARAAAARGAGRPSSASFTPSISVYSKKTGRRGVMRSSSRSVPSSARSGKRRLSGHELVAHRVGRRVQRDREVHRHARAAASRSSAPRPTVDTVTRRGAIAKAFGCSRIARGLDHGRQVEQRLAHPHEDDVRDRAARREELAHPAHLIDDLRGGEIAREAERAGRAEASRPAGSPPGSRRTASCDRSSGISTDSIARRRARAARPLSGAVAGALHRSRPRGARLPVRRADARAARGRGRSSGSRSSTPRR